MAAAEVQTPAQTVGWRLAPTVHGVEIGEDLVLLDLQDGTYFCLADGAQAVRLDPAGGVVIRQPDLVEDLRQAGLLTQGQVARTPVQALPVRTDLSQVRPSAADGAAWSRLMKASLAAHLAFRRRSFSQLLALASARSADDVRRLASPSPDLAAEAARLSRMRVWAPFNGECLARSYMALKYLRLCGHDAAWVVGVRTWPFDAHCWLQSGEVVLDDTAEHVRPYRPILVM